MPSKVEFCCPSIAGISCSNLADGVDVVFSLLCVLWVADSARSCSLFQRSSIERERERGRERQRVCVCVQLCVMRKPQQ